MVLSRIWICNSSYRQDVSSGSIVKSLGQFGTVEDMTAEIEERKRLLTPPKVEPNKKFKQEQQEQQQQQQSKKSKVRKYKAKSTDATSPLGVLEYEIRSLCKGHGLALEDITNDMKGILNNREIEEKYHRVVENVHVLQLLSNGDSIAIICGADSQVKVKKQVVVIPFALPGDVVTVKIYRTHPLYAEADLLSVQTPSKMRDDSLIQCRYFGKCSGCQFQNISYDDQLKIKRKTIQNAYTHFAPILTEQNKLPEILETQPSPLLYNYRTKLTPHFNIPTKKSGADLTFRPNFGFGAKGRPAWRQSDFGPTGSIMDIEECSIGTPIVNLGLKNERKKLETTYKTYKKGATILLRENTKIKDGEKIELGEASRDFDDGTVSSIEVAAAAAQNGLELVKTCVVAPRQIVQEIVGIYKFEFSAGEFFQNNNSILPLVTRYVKDNLLHSQPNYLVDAYCGSGLFSITCSSNVTKVIGVEVSAESVKFAKHNAILNNTQNTKFIVGKAEEIFKDIDTPSSQTSVILDPPRKGCDEVFLNQLSAYKPAKIVYISCNVHSQARDIEWFLNNTENGSKYVVESIKGFDFFPQTHHIETVTVLSMV
ncbi:TRM2 [Candida oxycetoniae]|uniref:TRM2 n=1 Tax=Candida oxycetoniae TaxID=497107 RepID=A0AAI9SY81_9ASCO|nr:TRM2 [Candida oxycetoniae]KAI3405353.2 TRM2 [Candida oxycetoniae]